MVNSSGQDKEVVLEKISRTGPPRPATGATHLLKRNPHPLVVFAPDIKEALPVANVADLLVLVQMLMEKHLHLLLVDGAHLLGRHGDLITVLVSPLLS